MKLLSLVLFGCAAISSAQTPMEKTIVIVNGQAIEGKSYYKRMEVMPNVGSLVNGKFVESTPGYLAMSKLINETLLLQLAKEKNVFPAESEVDAKLKESLTDNPDLLTSLKKIGFTEEDYRYDLRLQLAEFKLQTMGINITDQEVEKFYKDNAAAYTLPKRYLMRVIAVDTEDKKVAVDKALASGKAFGDVAREMSLDISRANDGKMGEVPEKSLAGGTQAAVMSTKKGSTTDWLTNGELSVKFLIEDILQETKVALDAELKKNIRINLMLDRGQIKNNLAQMMDEMRKKSKIEFQGTIFDSQLKSSFGKG